MRRPALTLALLLSATTTSTAPAATPAVPDTVRLVILSDFNGPYGSVTYPPALKRVMARIVNDWRPDAVLSAGDLIAGQKASLPDTQVRAMWAAFDRDVAAPLRQAGIPFTFTLGNHDASLPRDRREAQAYWQAHRPGVPVVDGAAFPFRWSFTLGEGTVFVAALDAAGPQVNADQRAWLRAQLADPAARRAGVRLVVGHLPLAGISAEKNRAGEVLNGAAELRSVMEAGGVLAFVHGHHAAYYPGRLGRLNVLSSGGIGGRDYVGHPRTARSTVTVLTVRPAAGQASFVTFNAETGQAIPTDTLPAEIRGLNGPVTRVSEFIR